MITIKSVKQNVADIHDLSDDEEFQAALDQCFPLRDPHWTALWMFGASGQNTYQEIDQDTIDEIFGYWDDAIPENVEMQQKILNGEYKLERDPDAFDAGIVFWCFQQKGLMEKLEEPVVFQIWW